MLTDMPENEVVDILISLKATSQVSDLRVNCSLNLQVYGSPLHRSRPIQIKLPALQSHRCYSAVGADC
jgi:hypothetical protein